ncbi:MAG: hypothetical protein JJD92_16485 [Frankiaceae bacterium]|nr:hypothetical protein [Frankiaceae bacterium]
MRRTPLVALPVVALALGAAALAPSAQGATASSAVTFDVPRIVDPIHVYGEPNLEVNPKTGAVHATGPQGTGTQRSIWNVSVDGGDSYRIVQNLPENSDRAAVTGALPSKSALGPGGGDTEIKISRDGRAWFNDLAALASFTSVTTTDDGKTTSVANPLAIPKPVGDRQWMALYDPQPSDNPISPYKGKVPLNYMEYADQVNGDDIAISTDGEDYSKSAGIFANDGVHNPNHGTTLVDQHTGKFLSMSTDKGNNSLALVVGVPAADATLTFHYNTIATDLIGDPQTLFPVLTQDGARNLYAVWIDGKTYQTWYSWAPPGADNEWKVWSEPRQISSPPSNVGVFPWVAAGKAPGIINVAWYGTDKTLKQLGPDGPSAKLGQTWELWFAQVDKANSSAPHVVQVKAAPHPMHYNDICLLGTLCISGEGNRNQADFFKVLVDPNSGRPRIIYTDSSNRLSQTGADSAADHQGAALDTVVTLNTGLNSNTGQPLTPKESTAPVSSWTDPAGDALFKPLGGAKVPGADVLSVEMKLEGGNVVANLKLAGALGTAATGAGTPTAQVVVRWQMGDTLYYIAAEATPAGPLAYYGGKTDSVDLCSVSGCKPNYLTYNAFPNAGTAQGSGSADGGTIQIKVPASALGSPTTSSLLESAMAFVTASPHSGVVPQNNGTDFADIAPLQLEGTKAVNVRFGAAAAAPPTVVQPPSGGGNPPTSGGNLAATGLNTVLPTAAVLLLLAGMYAARRRRSAD